MQPGRTRTAIVGVAAVLTVGSVARAPTGDKGTALQRPDPDAFRIVGVTSPSRIATLAAVLPARIAAMPAPEGTVVQRGELVVALENGVQKAKTELARAKAESSLGIELARVRREHARREWDRLVKLHGSDYASSKELSDALADTETRRLEYELALFNQAQAARSYAREQRLLEEFSIRAPFTGYVSEHLKQAGETVDPLEGILTLVKLDPLEVAVDCPLALAPFVRMNDRLWVRPVDPNWPPRIGTVVLKSRAADGASQTFKVKLNVPNGDAAWVSGLKVVVDFADHGAVRTGSAGSKSSDVTVSQQGRRGRRPPQPPAP